MNKLVICLLILAPALILTPASQAAPRCISFTNFCDSIQIDNVQVGGITGNLLWGEWDWQCDGGESKTVIIGKGGRKIVLATRPIAQFGYVFAYATSFVLQKSTHLFDLYLAKDEVTYFNVDMNEPWTQVPGSCPWDVMKGNGKPRLTGR